jgi:hypothetical protein
MKGKIRKACRLRIYKYELKYNLKCLLKMQKDDHFVHATIEGKLCTCGIPSSEIFYYTYLPNIKEFCDNFGNSNFGFDHLYQETKIFNEIVRGIKEKGLPVVEKDHYAEQKKYPWGTLIVFELSGFKK